MSELQVCCSGLFLLVQLCGVWLWCPLFNLFSLKLLEVRVPSVGLLGIQLLWTSTSLHIQKHPFLFRAHLGWNRRAGTCLALDPVRVFQSGHSTMPSTRKCEHWYPTSAPTTWNHQSLILATLVDVAWYPIVVLTYHSVALESWCQLHSHMLIGYAYWIHFSHLNYTSIWYLSRCRVWRGPFIIFPWGYPVVTTPLITKFVFSSTKFICCLELHRSSPCSLIYFWISILFHPPVLVLMPGPTPLSLEALQKILTSGQPIPLWHSPGFS